MKRFAGSTLAVLVLCLLAREGACGTTFTLGGTAGWTNTANVDYNQWVSLYRIKIGDTVVFANYDSIEHSVVLVDKEAYDTCLDSGNKLSTVTTIAPDIQISYTLAQSGQFYAVCAQTGHCLQGMKVSIQVLNTDGSVNQTAAAADSKNPSASSALPMPGSSWVSQLLVVMVATFSVMLAGTTMFA